MTSSLTFRSGIAEGLVSFSLLPRSLPFLFPRNRCGSQERSRQEGKGKEAADEEKAKNREKTSSLLLLKEKGTTVRGGHADRERRNDGAKKPSLFPI